MKAILNVASRQEHTPAEYLDIKHGAFQRIMLGFLKCSIVIAFYQPGHEHEKTTPGILQCSVAFICSGSEVSVDEISPSSPTQLRLMESH